MRADHRDHDHHFHESPPPFRVRCGGAFEPEVLRPPPGGERAPTPFIGEWCVECRADHADDLGAGAAPRPVPAHRAAEDLGRLSDRIDRDAARAAFEAVLRDGPDIPEAAAPTITAYGDARRRRPGRNG